MQVWALGSGSSGNGFLLRARDTLVLVDCGLGIRTLEARLAALDLEPSALSAVLVTHEHSDHIGGVPALARRYGVPIYATAGTLRAANNGRLPETARTHPVVADRAFSVGDFAVHPFAVPHDATEPVGYRLNTGRARVAILTDLGHVPPPVQAQLRDVELLVLEFNHDPDALANGPYHATLKRRISSPLGHLSNAEAAACLTGALSRTHRAVWLAHLSEVNNSQRRAGAAARAAARAAGYPDLPIHIAARGRLSLHWDLETPCQPRLF